MEMFEQYPTHDRYRTLEDLTPDETQVGPDVFALQCAINGVLGLSTATDGSLGPTTGELIWRVQRKLAITVDGKAGQETQRALVLKILSQRLKPWTTRYLLVQGIISKESSFWLGNYSAQRDDGHYDAGVTQQNTAHNDPADAFDPVKAVQKLAAYAVEGLGLYNDRKLYVGDDHSRRRRLSLAAGRWNAPAYANWLAGVKPNAEPGPTARELIEAYMAAATVVLNER